MHTRLYDVHTCKNCVSYENHKCLLYKEFLQQQQVMCPDCVTKDDLLRMKVIYPESEVTENA